MNIVDLTKKLISFETTEDKQSEIDACLDFITEIFQEEEFKIKKYEFNKKKSLLISFEDKKEFDIILNGHIDVVPGDKEQFTPRIQGDKLYGRGSVDMKGGMACLMTAMKALKKEKPDVALMIVSDEEPGGFEGTKKLLEEGYKGKFVVGAEPNHSLNPDEYTITIKHKGVIQLEVSSTGIATHAATPWKGENAIEKLMKSLEEFKRNFELITEDYWKTTYTISTIQAGDATNKVPDKAKAKIDIRYTEKTNPNDIITKAKKIFDKVKIIEKEPMLNTEKHPLIKKLQEVIKKNNKKSILNKGHGSSDLRFTSAKNMPSIIFGPQGENYHGKDEYVSITSLKEYTEILIEFLS